MAVAWNHIQLRLIELLGDEGMALARQLAMTTYRSEADFDERFGRPTEADGTPSIVSYLEYQGRKLVDRFDRETYRVLAGAMDRHDIGAGRGTTWPRPRAARRSRGASHRARHRGRHPLRAGAGAAPRRGRSRGRPSTDYRELHSNKGHDAFLVEWDQLTAIIRDLLP